MLNKIIIRLLDLWAKLSLREKRLAMLTGSVVVLMLAVMTFQRVSGSLRELDNTLSGLKIRLSPIRTRLPIARWWKPNMPALPLSTQVPGRKQKSTTGSVRKSIVWRAIPPRIWTKTASR